MSASALATVDRPSWQQQSACLGHPDPDLFHGNAEEMATVISSVCRGCPVRQECLLDALDRGDQTGVWGGTTPDQRAELRRLARKATQQDRA